MTREDKSNGVNLGLGSWLFVQCALLVIHYGFNKTMPYWVLWFPSIVVGSVIAITLIVVAFIFIGSWIAERL